MSAEVEADRAPARICAVLAGGASRRMGAPKATVELAGRSLISYPIAAARAAGLDPVVIAKRDSELPELDCEIRGEPDEPRHPLVGVLAAIAAAAPRPVVVVACDMPGLAPGLLAELATRPAPLVVPSEGDRLHPLCARYAPSLEQPLRAALGRRSPLAAAVSELDPVLLEGGELARHGAPARLLANVNSPEELAALGRRDGA